MKSFKTFINEAVVPPESVVTGGVLGQVPSAVVYHGSHSEKKKETDPVEQGKEIDGVPCAVVFHGQHAYHENKINVVEKESPKYETEESYFDKNENTHIHPSQLHVGNELAKHQKREGFDTHHIHKYTAGSRVVNKALYSAHTKGEKVPKEVNAFGEHHDIGGLDKAIKRNKLKHDTHLYSGVGFEPSKMAANHPEHHIHLPAYTSTSVNKHVAHLFASNQGNDKSHLRHSGLQGHVLHIHAHAGQHAAYVDKESHYKGESEVLLPRGITLKIHGHTDHEDQYGSVLRVHHATIVH